MQDHLYDIIESLRIRAGEEEFTAEDILDIIEREVTEYDDF